MSIPNLCNSRRASIRNHSITSRCTDASERRLWSRQGGKSAAGKTRPPSRLALAPFKPDQETVCEHDRHRIPMKPLPPSPLVVIPTQLPFRFFMILFHPVSPVRVLDHHFQRRARREVTPIISVLALGIVRRALADQSAGVTRPIPIDAPATQGREAGAQDPSLTFAPADHSPGALGLGGNHLIHTLNRTARVTPARDAEIGTHTHYTTFSARLQPVQEVGVVTIVGIAHHTGVLHATPVGLLQQVERNLGFGLKSDLLRDMRFPAPLRIIRPFPRQIESGRDWPGPRPFGIMAVDRHLTVTDLASGPGVLARHPDRVLPFLEKAGIIKDQDAIAFTPQREHPFDPLAV